MLLGVSTNQNISSYIEAISCVIRRGCTRTSGDVTGEKGNGFSGYLKGEEIFLPCQRLLAHEANWINQ
jgi:hypothetical protein